MQTTRTNVHRSTYQHRHAFHIRFPGFRIACKPHKLGQRFACMPGGTTRQKRADVVRRDPALWSAASPEMRSHEEWLLISLSFSRKLHEPSFRTCSHRRAHGTRRKCGPKWACRAAPRTDRPRTQRRTSNSSGVALRKEHGLEMRYMLSI